MDIRFRKGGMWFLKSTGQSRYFLPDASSNFTHFRHVLVTALVLCLTSNILPAQFDSILVVDLSYEDVSGEYILQDLSKRHSLRFSYSEIDLPQHVTFEYAGSLYSAIDALMDKLRLEHRWIAKNIVLREGVVYGKRVKGYVIDQDTKTPLVGATISVLTANGEKGASTDVRGRFELPRLEVGRYDIRFDYLGYQQVQRNQVLVKSGKELVLNVGMAVSSTLSIEIL
ncbi:MAG: carboxypeptidase-like regulatory domain-containing protein [Saprospiraceae bacterium]|nr:carboxypeptidase-like regulatory domain-containing protein [Saprospiraceae bacterium]